MRKRKLVNLAVKSKNLFCKILLYLLVAFQIGLDVLLVGLDSFDKFLNLLVPLDLELALGVYGVSKFLDLTINVSKTLGDDVLVCLK